MPAVTGLSQLLTLHKTSITVWGSGFGPKNVSRDVYMCVCVLHSGLYRYQGKVCYTERWEEPDRVSVFTLVNVALSEPRLKQRALASGLYVDTPNQPLRTSSFKGRLIQRCVALRPADCRHAGLSLCLHWHWSDDGTRWKVRLLSFKNHSLETANVCIKFYGNPSNS